eukprot:CAMPEP_0195521210 /NCGR_PEP_ID=MMETSP0794_2-20130614/18207_1 /TAXON_ID=515487 /ORGANISM="Stephanopyxis turris, Strain CCMP 815" /LENGTH=688 /DNA_ID=CAMNT_0040650717 /DNA_START=74 /DNA_END=2140 /DNA_ORIENTATION=+
MKFILIAAGAAIVAAKCPNDCSSHGDCNAKNQCECHRNYFGADCSSRLCPAGKAFIDSALGDVNGDNSVGVDLVWAEGRAATPVSELFSYKYGSGRDSHDVTASWNEAHFYQECSNKGICDTATGQCACFPGYEGSGCARKSCENDCSGHGACKNYQGTGYNMWDKDATLYCDCDAGYSGPGCEQRVCPSGVDPVEGSNIDSSRMYRIAFRTLSSADGDFDSDTFYSVPYGPVTWSIRLTDEFGDEWTTSLLTTNYDVVVDTSGADDEPIYSMPIIAAATMDEAGSWVDSDSEYSVAAYGDLPSSWNAFGDGNYHVAQQVKDALEALPDSAAGNVNVHEVYISPAVADSGAYLLSTLFPAPFTGLANDDYHLEWPTLCGAEDIYLSGEAHNTHGGVVGATETTIAGCGVAIVDSQVGSDACPQREGNNDVNDAIAGTGFWSGATIADQLSDVDLYVIADPLGTSSIDAASTLNALSIDGNPSTNGGFALFTTEAVYYQWPHYSNSDGASTRFPLFENLETSCDDVDGYYASGNTYYERVFAFDTDGDTAVTTAAGLSLFLYFEEATIETAPQVDYTFTNQAANAFLSADLFSPDDGAHGEDIEGTSGGSGDYESHSLVRVNDVTGARSWDVAYHGRRQYFLDDQSATTLEVSSHICAKRGICDYSTGLCDCFSGFTGANCAIQNALAY